MNRLYVVITTIRNVTLKGKFVIADIFFTNFITQSFYTKVPYSRRKNVIIKNEIFFQIVISLIVQDCYVNEYEIKSSHRFGTFKKI